MNFSATGIGTILLGLILAVCAYGVLFGGGGPGWEGLWLG